MNEKTSHDFCVCGSGKSYANCCLPFHSGSDIPPSPETLMRSRYSAYCLRLNDYLLATWHRETRPEVLSLDTMPPWTSLRILSASTRDERGSVHFQGFYTLADSWGCLEEISEFNRENGRWYYVSGEVKDAVFKPERNDICPCGSGKKYKQCCLRR
ncbi:MAG: YchJ family protein [Porticoccaceae bacterium]